MLAYVRVLPRRVPDRYGGHNPLGGLSVLAMLLMLLLHTGLGLFAADVDGLHEGPLSFLVSYDQARQASELHALAVDILLGLVGLHLAAILFHLVYKRENLTGAMVTGRGPVPAGLQEPRIAGDGRAVLVLAIAVMVVIGGIELAQRVF
jgi:cytochrome b